MVDFRNKEDLLNIGKLVFSGYRFVKHFLDDETACKKVSYDVLNFIEIHRNQMMVKRVCRHVTLNCLFEYLWMLIDNKYSLLSEVINIVGDFAKTEIPQKGATTLIYDVFKMNEIALTMLTSVETVIETMESEISPLLEHAGFDKTILRNLTMPPILVSKLYKNIHDSNVMMICEGNTRGCELFDEYEAKIEEENKKALVLRNNSVGKLSLSFASILPYIFFRT